MKLLHIDSGILGDNSVSRRLSAATVAELKARHPGLAVTYRDLVANPIAHLTGAHLAAGSIDASQHDAQMRKDLADAAEALDQFLAADIVIVGAPMYNFSIPSQLKAWIDRLAVAGKTFRYTEKGPEGLAGAKKVIIASSRGGFYGAGTPLAAIDHQENYLRAVFGFFGITDLTFVRAEGVNISAEQKAKSIAEAERGIPALDIGLAQAA
ncbi:MAG: FMN-dependent NADH-azoreductase [Phreatobacter sp.]|uniref:FMN-dependent NADH-azoreductase n=1 Tax=Phreatobacter sp. TaxID=1966341 RepID=UPI001A39C248|nr:FMN-dependent NADH-azoreductase [Phreatobacter sp.]MBL8567906.1 FMN-dependent NADH-azoreductase [Phreatobacter sp.]